MTWSLKLRNGDLDLSSSSYGAVTGENKLAQDLRCFILEQMGTDDLHPEYGSLLDGGVQNGQYVEGVVGQLNDSTTKLLIESELRRIVSAYQTSQLARAKEDQARYGKATLSKGEILLGVTSFDIETSYTSMTITINLATANDTTVPLSITLPT